MPAAQQQADEPVSAANNKEVHRVPAQKLPLKRGLHQPHRQHWPHAFIKQAQKQAAKQPFALPVKHEQEVQDGSLQLALQLVPRQKIAIPHFFVDWQHP